MFEVSADAYGRFMGRFSEPLASELVALLDLGLGRRALDVGCGPGALTARLVERLGVEQVTAVDPSASFVEAVRRRLPGLDVRRAGAERLPFEDASFDLVLAQLVVHFMDDPVAGLREMHRVAAPGGQVAASVWDMTGGTGPLELYARAVRELDPAAQLESDRPGTSRGHLAELFTTAGMTDLRSEALTVVLAFERFEDWWQPFTLGVGPSGAYVAALSPDRRAALRARCEELAGPAPFEVSASAWCVVARVEG